MGMTMTQKILARAAGVERCRAGELLMCKLDLVLGNDITAPVAINEFNRMGATKVFDPAKIALIPIMIIIGYPPYLQKRKPTYRNRLHP